MLTTVNDDERPDFIDGIDDFKRLRWEAAAESRAVVVKKREYEASLRALERRSWESNGEESMKKLQYAKYGVEQILGPHLLKKNSGIELISWVNKFENSKDKRIEYFTRKPYSIRFLYYIRPPFYLKGSKTNIIRWKWVYMSELRRFLDRSKYFTQGAMSQSVTTESKALKKMEIGQRSLVPLKREDLDLLYENRDEKRYHEDKLYVIQKLFDKYAKIRTCDSLLHSTPSGCPVCEVILMGGQREPVEYVRSVNRTSGAEKMMKLTQELEDLDVEKKEQDELIEACVLKIADLERVMFKLARDSIQSWWTAVLARRRSLREDGKRRKSLYWYRIRRLCQMKYEIDNLFCNIDYNMLEYKYSEIVPELKEYMAKVAADRTDLSIKLGKVFLQKLRKAVARARRRKYMEEELMLQERAAAQEAVKKKKNAAALLAMRKLCKTIEKKKFICIREKCEGRTFFSVERYNAHMSIHYEEDKVRNKKILADKVQKVRKEIEAGVVVERVAAIRASVLQFADEDTEDREKKSKRLIMQDPQAVDLGDGSYVKPSNWNTQEHFRIINQEKNVTLYQLQLVSKRADVEAPSVVTLSKSPFRLGALPTNECSFVCTSQAKRDGLIAKIHCIISVSNNADYDEPPRVHDNHSMYGTYIVSGESDGAMKVTTSVTDGDQLNVGDLLCIGVKKYGAAVLEPAEASGACIVYRVTNYSAKEDFRIFNQVQNVTQFQLQLVSKHDDIVAPALVTLNKSQFRFGSLENNECKFLLTQTKHDDLIAKLHCTISVPRRGDITPSVHDNNSMYGTYIVYKDSDHAMKVTTTASISISEGDPLGVGDLLYLGVIKDGPAVLKPSEVSGAGVVYRVKIK
jgi:hypothetical protein